MAVVGVAAVAAAGLLVAQAQGDEVGPGERAERREIAELASCLRREGADVDAEEIDFEDDGTISFPTPENDAAANEVNTAMGRCAQEPGWEPPRPTDDELDHVVAEARDYVECLRPLGVEVPDPVVIDSRVYFGDEEQDELRSLDTDDPAVARALAECEPSA